jgi:hypothetical protein
MYTDCWVMGIKWPELTLAIYTHSAPTSTALRNLPLRSPHTFITRCLCTEVVQALSLFGHDPVWGPIKYNNIYRNTEEFETRLLFRAFVWKQISTAVVEDFPFLTSRMCLKSGYWAGLTGESEGLTAVRQSYNYNPLPVQEHHALTTCSV